MNTQVGAGVNNNIMETNTVQCCNMHQIPSYVQYVHIQGIRIAIVQTSGN